VSFTQTSFDAQIDETDALCAISGVSRGGSDCTRNGDRRSTQRVRELQVKNSGILSHRAKA